MADEEQSEPLLANVLPNCASAERWGRLEEALRVAPELLAALATYNAADRELFPHLC